VIDAVEKRFEICGIVGCSMGAIVGGLYACGHSPRQMLNLSEDFNKIEMFNPFNLDLNLSGIFDGKTTLKRFREWTDNREISFGRVPFIAVAYDLVSNTTILINKGQFSSAMRASSSVPYIYAPYSYGKYLFVDGGVEHPLPIAFKNQIDEDAICIAVNVLPGVNMQAQGFEANSQPSEEKSKLKLYKVFLHSAMQNQGFIAMQALINYRPDIIIDAWHRELSVFDFDKAEEFYQYGYSQAQKAIATYSEPGFIDSLLKKYQGMIQKINLLGDS
jgi:NTE family protein